MRIVKLAAAIALVANFGMPMSAQAEECSCVAAGVEGASVGKFVSTNGDVLTSGADDYVPAKAGAPVILGSDIMVGANSSAQISVGTSCDLTLQQSTVTRVSALANGNICVAPSSGAPAAPVATAPTPSLVPLIAVGGAGLGLALLLGLGGGDDDPVSP